MIQPPAQDFPTDAVSLQTTQRKLFFWLWASQFRRTKLATPGIGPAYRDMLLRAQDEMLTAVLEHTLMRFEQGRGLQIDLGCLPGLTKSHSDSEFPAPVVKWYVRDAVLLLQTSLTRDGRPQIGVYEDWISAVLKHAAKNMLLPVEFMQDQAYRDIVTRATDTPRRHWLAWLMYLENTTGTSLRECLLGPLGIEIDDDALTGECNRLRGEALAKVDSIWSGFVIHAESN